MIMGGRDGFVAQRGRRAQGAFRSRALAAVLAAVVALVATPAARATGDGKVRFLRNATSSFDPILTGSSTAERQWMASHYWEMRGYDPFFASKGGLIWAPPTHFYKDLYAIYPNRSSDQRLVAEHPDWVLRDAQGNKLFIPFACNGTSCTQYAADIGNPEWRAHWIGQARAVLSKGYAGVFIDDVNMLMRVSNGASQPVRPIDRRTGAPMTDADWRRYVAEFVEQIRAAFPAKEISHNPIWYVGHDDPMIRRQALSADLIELERGFNDRGIVGGTGRFGYETYLAHVDWLHGLGKSVVFEPYGLDATSREFELASYFLVKARVDSISSSYQADPGNWWPGWATDLGMPQGARYGWNGLIRRDFAAGTVLVNQPGQATKMVTLPAGSAWTNLAGNRVTSVTLEGRRGAVLLRQDAASESAPTPAPTEPTTEPAPSEPTSEPKSRRGKGRTLRG